ncbi:MULTISPECIES: hypothetical protein [unclassified Bradyrhizobium]|uniref:hypothetical protein n=1 Tax=unclassified Bradyrhizobium TaxID=2631580 RepID=UPI002916C80E|nr:MULTISPECIES: hypothetical protein [unclassified Bradyrhizobium]
MITDLDELVLKCRGEEARNYLREAVASYKAGANRACIVSVWIAVVFDLIEKVRELALSGDPEAKLLIDTYERWRVGVERGDAEALKKSLEFERSIIDQTYSKFEFFEHQQLIDLQRLREDRNRCAHPTYQRQDAHYQPSAELARLHLRNAVEFVLSQPPVQGKAAVQSLVSVVGSNLFPSDYKQALSALKAAGLGRPKDVLVKTFTDKLLFGFFDGPEQLKERRQTLVALRACCDGFPSFAEPRIASAINKICRQISDTEFPLTFAILRHVPQSWSFLDEDNRRKFNDFLRRAPVARIQAVIGASLSLPGLRDTAESRLSSFSAEELKQVLQSKDRVIVAQAVRLYSSARNWPDANSIYGLVVEPLLASFTAGDVEMIVRASWNGADLRGSHSFNAFLQYVYDHELMPKDRLLELLREGGLSREADRLTSVDDDLPF